MTTPNETKEFTAQEFQFIFGACLGLTNQEIAERFKIGEEAVMNIMVSVFDKAGVSTRLELVVLAMNLLNNGRCDVLRLRQYGRVGNNND